MTRAQILHLSEVEALINGRWFQVEVKWAATLALAMLHINLRLMANLSGYFLQLYIEGGLHDKT